MDVGDAPNWLTFSPDGRYAYSANTGANSVSSVDVAARKAIAEIKVGPVSKRVLAVWVPAERSAARPAPTAGR